MKKSGLFLLASFLILVSVSLSYAWEFSMTGEFEWRYRYWGRIGGYNDLFGDMSVQNNPNTSLIGFAGPNYYRGYNPDNSAMNTGSNASNVRVVRGGFSSSESDGFLNDQRMTFYPKLAVNNALHFLAVVDLAGIRQKYDRRDVVTNGPLERYYEDRVSRNAFDTAMIPSISQFKLTAQTPWGIISLSTAKDFVFGTGALLGLNNRGSALVMIIPYGPFRIIPALWVARSYPAQEGYASYTAPALPSYTTNPDSATKNTLQAAGAITYSNGPVDMGWILVYQKYHVNNYVSSTIPGVTTRTDSQGISWTYYGYDHAAVYNAFYLKYNNGRLFANAEYGFSQDDRYYIHAFPDYTERSYAFAELGGLAGPAKTSFMFAWSGGNALNKNNVTKNYGGWAVNYQVMTPYQYLMFYTYGGGNDTPWVTIPNGLINPSAIGQNCDENGQMGDAYALAARLDFALAANLNIWGSYLWAHRVEQNGFYAGGKGTTSTNGSTTAAAAQTWKRGNGFGANPNPFVDDGYLGWETNVGVDWKLLEHMTFRSRWAYWKPGPWFDQAYKAIGSGSNEALLQDKSGIHAFESTLEVAF